MQRSLRQSDVIARKGKNQFLLILLKTSPPNARLVIERLMSVWQGIPESSLTDIEYDMAEME